MFICVTVEFVSIESTSIFFIIFLQLLSTAASLLQISFTVPPNKSAPFIGFPKNGMITYGRDQALVYKGRDALGLVFGLVWKGPLYFCPLRLMDKGKKQEVPCG